MKLTIIITGLVLLAPDRSNGRLHLFFPQMDMGHSGAVQHAPYLAYRSSAGAAREPLGGWTLDLGTLSRPGAAPAVPGEVADLSGLFSWEVPRDWVTGAPPREIQGRLTLPWPDAMTRSRAAKWLLVRGARWWSVRLTHEVVLQYDVPNTPPATWALSSLPSGPGGTRSIAAFRPTGTRDDTIMITNLPTRTVPDLKRPEEAVHFQGYVDIFRRSLFDQLLARPRVYLDDDEKAYGMSPFNCMLASAEVRP